MNKTIATGMALLFLANAGLAGADQLTQHKIKVSKKPHPIGSSSKGKEKSIESEGFTMSAVNPSDTGKGKGTSQGKVSVPKLTKKKPKNQANLAMDSQVGQLQVVPNVPKKEKPKKGHTSLQEINVEKSQGASSSSLLQTAGSGKSDGISHEVVAPADNGGQGELKGKRVVQPVVTP